MYEPEIIGLNGNGESVLVMTEDGRRVGRYTGESRPSSESYQIAVIDHWNGNIDYTSYFHKEDIYENTDENAEMLKA